MKYLTTLNSQQKLSYKWVMRGFAIMWNYIFLHLLYWGIYAEVPSIAFAPLTRVYSSPPVHESRKAFKTRASLTNYQQLTVVNISTVTVM